MCFIWDIAPPPEVVSITASKLQNRPLCYDSQHLTHKSSFYRPVALDQILADYRAFKTDLEDFLVIF